MISRTEITVQSARNCKADEKKRVRIACRAVILTTTTILLLMISPPSPSKTRQGVERVDKAVALQKTSLLGWALIEKRRKTEENKQRNKQKGAKNGFVES